MIIKGKIWKFKNNIDTDVIIPARYLNTSDPKELALHCMEDYDSEFVKKMNQGDIIVAGRNFGCGSSREHAPIALKSAGISCIIAQSFARIFFRNAINIGLLIFESEEIADQCSEGDLIKVDTAKGLIENINKNRAYKLKPLPDFIQNIISLGGLREYVKEEVRRREGSV
jgi:3-isopropylmalate/(R)-2-methylmalate dehydratase small subunit